MKESDLDLYLEALERKKVVFYGTDDEEKNIKKICDMQWQAIVKFYSQLTQ